MAMPEKIVISIVSHNQFTLIENLLHDLDQYCAENIEVIITVNMPETVPAHWQNFNFPIRYLHNKNPKGFGANHNAAFAQCESPYFCVLNPDIQLTNNPFVILIESLNDAKIGVVAPKIVDEHHQLQDSARKFMTLLRILRRVLLRKRDADYPIENNLIYPDWVAGMFMLFRREAFEKVSGFDERYFMYCEDADLCWRLKKANYQVVLNPAVAVIHEGQRASHKNWRYFWWHCQSLIRFFLLRFK